MDTLSSVRVFQRDAAVMAAFGHTSISALHASGNLPPTTLNKARSLLLPQALNPRTAVIPPHSLHNPSPDMVHLATFPRQGRVNHVTAKEIHRDKKAALVQPSTSQHKPSRSRSETPGHTHFTMISSLGQGVTLPCPLYVPLLLFSLVYVVTWVIYMRCFHPLSKYPGPFFASVSRLWLAVQVKKGHLDKTQRVLHSKYGAAFAYDNRPNGH